MNTTTAPASSRPRARPIRRTGPARGLILLLLGALLGPLLLSVATPGAFAAGCGGSNENSECKNYSLYQLASNASTYFGEKNSPDAGDGFSEDWTKVTRSPASGGSLLGYADPEFSLGNVIGWFFAEVSGSSQTVTYDTLKAVDSNASGQADAFSGMLDYAHFGAANRDLGLDTMSTGISGEIVAVVGGAIMWAMYALALFVSMAFGVVIMLLKMLNPFMWFGAGVKAVNETFGQGMVEGGDATVANGPLSGLVNWISDWYQLLTGIAWQALVPLFIGFTLLALVLFKKMDRGSLIRKLIVRIVFIGVGLPLIGSLYTGVLDKFGNLGVASAGPTRVVLSTYVDFETWMNRDRLAVPREATIGWDGDQASSQSMMSVRTSALAINKQSHPTAYAGINVGTKQTSAAAAWKNSQVNVTQEKDTDATSVFTTIGLLNRYITSQEMAASDFESGIKTSITRLDVDASKKEDWFVNKKTYGDAKDFGEEGQPKPPDHPVIAVRGATGLTSSTPGGDRTNFTTEGVADNCGFSVYADNGPVACNLSPLAAYNYLNTGFDSSSLTMYSSNNATSGFTRENHLATSQIGTGPAKFLYWLNAVTILASLVLLGFWYAIGMLASSVKRTFSLVAAIPFATLGAIAAIAKVIVYSLALIFEVIVTLFLYSFVSEFLISIPGIIAGPVSNAVAGDGLFGSALLGGIVVAVLTLISTLLIVGVTFALLRVRKVVLQAMDEVFTKLIDKFLETNTPPMPDKNGMFPALAAGAGAGAGMAMGNTLASGLGGRLGRAASPKPSASGQSAARSASTNAGGLNPTEAKALTGGGPLALETGDRSSRGPDTPGGSGVGDDPSDAPPGRGPGGAGTEGPDGVRGEDGRTGTGTGLDEKDGSARLTGGRGHESSSDKTIAQGLSARGSLSKLGYASGALGNRTVAAAAGGAAAGGVIAGAGTSGHQQGRESGNPLMRNSKNGSSYGRIGSDPARSGKSTQFGIGGGAAARHEAADASGASSALPASSQKGTGRGSRPAQSGRDAAISAATGQPVQGSRPRFVAGTAGVLSAGRVLPGTGQARAGVPQASPRPAPTQQRRGPAPKSLGETSPAPRRAVAGSAEPVRTTNAPVRPRRAPELPKGGDGPISHRDPKK